MTNTENRSINKISDINLRINKPLTFVLSIMLILFLLFSGGAISVTVQDGGLMGNGWTSGISWMWIPAILFLTLSILLTWVIFAKKNKL